VLQFFSLISVSLDDVYENKGARKKEECPFRKNENHLFFAAFALGVNKILLSWLRHYKKGQKMLRQTLMTTNKNIVHSSGVIILSYKNEFRGKLFFL
jgi:hypothetical protein